jgi:hypothetical protein
MKIYVPRPTQVISFHSFPPPSEKNLLSAQIEFDSIEMSDPTKIAKFRGAQPSHLVFILTLVTSTSCPKLIIMYGRSFDCPNEQSDCDAQILPNAV